MSESIITTGGADTWINSTKTRSNYGDTAAVHVKVSERRGLVRPPLPNILGRTVTSATLYGHAGPSGLVAQQLSYTPVDAHWTQGRATWQNQPGIDGADTLLATIGALPAGGLVALPVTAHLQAVADGTADYHGWRIGTDSSAANQRFYSTQSGEPAWELHVTLAADADEPSNPRPDGGGAVSTAEPVLAWDFEEQASYQVQVDTPVAGVDPDEVAPDYDSGWVTSPEPEHDLAAATYTPPAGTAPTFWRVRAVDTDGNESEWMPWAEFTVAALPTLVIDSPTGAVGDPRVQVLAHLTGGTVASWEVWATGPSRADVRWRSEVQDGAVEVEVPAKNADKRKIFTASEGGWIYVRVNDDVDRAVAVGEQTYVETWIPVEFAANDTLIAPTGLSVTQYGEGDPRLVWSWSMSDVPDGGFNLLVDDEIAVTIDAADIAPVAGRYTFTDSGEVSPSRAHKLGVAALWAGESSASSPTFTRAHAVRGVWLLPDSDIDPIRLAGAAGPEASQSDRVATYTPVKGDDVDITYDHEGIRGTFKGGISLDTYPNPAEVWAALDRLEKLRKSRVRLARMVWGSKSIMVRLRHPHALPHGTFTEQNLRHAVSFEFVEVGD